MDKSELRQRIKAAVAALSPEDAAAEDAAVCRLILSHERWQQARSVFCFVPCPGEIDVTPLLRAALEQGKISAVPLVTGKGEMEARRIGSMAELRPGAFGIPEPPADSETVAPEDIDLIIVPGMAFTADGHRLGKGGGYYDRWLPRCSGYKLAPCRRCCLVDELPREAWDIPVDEVVIGQEIKDKE